MPKKKSAKFNLSSELPAVSFSGDTKIKIIDYDASKFQEKEVEKIEECFPFKETLSVSWINVTGIDQTEVIKQLDDYFGLHPLVLEDIQNLEQRPRMEDFGNYLYLALKILNYDEKKEEINSWQISIILAKNFVITFQPGKETDIFEPIREKIRKNKGKIRKMGTDYLAYRIADAIVDRYFDILEALGDKVEFLEEELVSNPSTKTLQTLHELKKEIVQIRKSVWPLREIINSLERGESSLIKKTTRVYLRDVYYHTVQLIDNIETSRDMLSEMIDIYLSSMSNKLNEIMKVLTIIATIFMPLTFLVGLYGMNFKFMPELSWHFGYPMVLGIIILIAVLMLIYFKRKRWL